MHTYEIRQNETGQNIWQIRDDGRQRIVSPEHHGYTEWLAAGNTPPVIPYTPPEMPDLDSYKRQKKDQITQSAKNQIGQIVVYREPGFPENLNPDIWDTLIAEFSHLVDKKVDSGLTTAEQQTVDYLNSILQTVKPIQSYEIELKQAADAAQTHAAVDEITWQYDNGFAETAGG